MDRSPLWRGHPYEERMRRIAEVAFLVLNIPELLQHLRLEDKA